MPRRRRENIAGFAKEGERAISSSAHAPNERSGRQLTPILSFHGVPCTLLPIVSLYKHFDLLACFFRFIPLITKPVA